MIERKWRILRKIPNGGDSWKRGGWKVAVVTFRRAPHSAYMALGSARRKGTE